MKKLVRLVLTATLLALAGVAAAATQTVTLAVKNMTCALCPITVYKALEKVPGVAAIQVNYPAKTATVTFDDTKTNVEALIKATTNAGYPSTPKP